MEHNSRDKFISLWVNELAVINLTEWEPWIRGSERSMPPKKTTAEILRVAQNDSFGVSGLEPNLRTCNLEPLALELEGKALYWVEPVRKIWSARPPITRYSAN